MIPTYNREQYIGACLDSLQRQSYPNLLILLYDDGSSDNTVKVAKTYPNVRILQGVENRGVAFARNALLDACTTRLAAWQDSDDLANHFRIQHQLNRMRKDNAGIVYCNWEFFRQSEPSLAIEPHIDLENGTRCIGGAMFDCTEAKHVLFDDAITLGGEDLIWRKALENLIGPPALEHRTLYYVRQHRDRISSLKKLAANRIERAASDKAYAEALQKL